MRSLFVPSSPFDPPWAIYSFLGAPLTFTARLFHHLFLALRPKPARPYQPIRVVSISDTHTNTTDIPDGDLLIHAGDLANVGNVSELQEQIDWLRSLPHAHKVVIAGNHDTYLDLRSRKTLSSSEQQGKLDWGDIHYLQHRSVTLTFPGHGQRKLSVYGAPQIPACGGPEFAFQYSRHQDAWSGTIPAETDILVTHTPPRWHLDLAAGLGCEWLLKECWRVRPRLHVFGHVHAGYGRETVLWDEGQAAYERICAREGGFLFDLINPFSWLDLARVLLYGTRNLIWTTLWGGDESDDSLMINAALMYRSSGSLGNLPQIEEI